MNKKTMKNAVFKIFRHFEKTEEMTDEEALFHFEDILSRYGKTEYYDFDSYQEERENASLEEYENAEMPKV